MSDHPNRPASRRLFRRTAAPARCGRCRAGSGRPAAPLSEDTRVAVEIRDLVANGALDEARDRFTELVAAHQRRALRIAYRVLA